jgi:hypothetical protein
MANIVHLLHPHPRRFRLPFALLGKNRLPDALPDALKKALKKVPFGSQAIRYVREAANYHGGNETYGRRAPEGYVPSSWRDTSLLLASVLRSNRKWYWVTYRQVQQ